MSLFAPHRFYRHRNMLDCKIQVLKSFRAPDGRYMLKVAWWTRFPLGITEKITIEREQVMNWDECTEKPKLQPLCEELR